MSQILSRLSRRVPQPSAWLPTSSTCSWMQKLTRFVDLSTYVLPKWKNACTFFQPAFSLSFLHLLGCSGIPLLFATSVQSSGGACFAFRFSISLPARPVSARSLLPLPSRTCALLACLLQCLACLCRRMPMHSRRIARSSQRSCWHSLKSCAFRPLL